MTTVTYESQIIKNFELASMDTETLRSMNKVIVAILNARIKTNQVKAAQSLKVGQQVKWTGRRGDMTGIVTKIKIKMGEVNAGNNGLWNVAATMLKSVV